MKGNMMYQSCYSWPPSVLTYLLAYFPGHISKIHFWQTFLVIFCLFTFPLSDHPPPPPRVLPITAHTWKPQPEMGTFHSLQVYLTIKLFLESTWASSKSIANEGERNNFCFSKIQLVGQKYCNKATLASKMPFSYHCFGFQSQHFLLLVGYNI